MRERLGRAAVMVVIVGGCLTAVVAPAEAQRRQPRTSQVRPLLQELLDKAEIQELLAEYMRLLEARDWVRYAELFAKNGELHFNQYHLVGSQVIRDTMMKIAPSDPKQPAPSAADLLTNVSIEVKGDVATGVSRWTGVTLGTDNRPVITRAGRYQDSFVRENNRWRFQKRVVLVDVTPAEPAR